MNKAKQSAIIVFWLGVAFVLCIVYLIVRDGDLGRTEPPIFDKIPPMGLLLLRAEYGGKMKKRIVWVTEAMAKAAAEKGLKAATQSSWNKWNNYAACTKEQLDKEIKKVGWSGDFQECSLCFYFDCDTCFLHRDKEAEEDCYCENSLYYIAIHKKLRAYAITKTIEYFKLFQIAAKELADEIKIKGKLRKDKVK